MMVGWNKRNRILCIQLDALLGYKVSRQETCRHYRHQYFFLGSIFNNIDKKLSIMKMIIITAGPSYGLIPATLPEFMFFDQLFRIKKHLGA
jgi:hypothetical protein